MNFPLVRLISGAPAGVVAASVSAVSSPSSTVLSTVTTTVPVYHALPTTSARARAVCAAVSFAAGLFTPGASVAALGAVSAVAASSPQAQAASCARGAGVRFTGSSVMS